MRETAPAPKKNFVNTVTVARALGVTTRTVQRWVHAGRVPCIDIRCGERPTWRFDIDEVLASLRKGPATESETREPAAA